MRRSELILGSTLGLVLVTAVIAFGAFWLSSRPKAALATNNSVENLTAVEAYNLAQPLAQNWNSDAVLLTARGGWQPKVDFTDGRTSWNFVFYSPGERATAMITAANGKAQMVRTNHTAGQVQTGDITGWQLDSPAVINQLLKLGGQDFMTFHADVNLVLTLDNQEKPTWRSTFLDTGTKQTYNLNVTADTGEFTP